MRSLSFSVLFVTFAGSAFAQGGREALTRGFEAKAAPVATAQEIAQGDLWVMETDFKPMRLIRVPVVDPKTNETREETFWYIIYRATNKALNTPTQDTTRTPINNYDPAPGPSLFIPEFSLVSDDNEVQRVYSDVIVPEAEAAIAAREMRGADKANVLKNSAEIVQPIRASDDEGAQPIYGVAIFRGVDPTTDNFKVYASGFSNGYRKINGPDGNPMILRREIVLDYWRPGDEFDANEREFQFRSQPRWVYRADEADPADGGEDALVSTPASDE